MIGSKFNFIISAAIFASTVYFLWVKIKRNTKFFKSDDSTDKSIENKSQENITLQPENELINQQSESLYENAESMDNEDDVAIENEFAIEEISFISVDDNGQINNISIDNLSIEHDLTDSHIVPLNESMVSTLCNRFQNININYSISEDHKIGIAIEKNSHSVNDHVVVECGIVNGFEGEQIVAPVLEEQYVDFKDNQHEEISTKEVVYIDNQYFKVDAKQEEISEDNFIEVSPKEMQEKEMIEESFVTETEAEKDGNVTVEMLAVDVREDGEIVEESFIGNVMENAVNKQDEYIGIMNDIETLKKEEIVEESIIGDEIEEPDVEIDENVTVESTIDEREDGEIFGESFIEIEKANINEDIVGVQVDNVEIIEVIEEEIIEKSFKENQYFHIEQDKNEDLGENVYTNGNISPEMSVVEDGEIVDESFIQNEAAKAEFDTTEEEMNDINGNINMEISIKEEIVAKYLNVNQTTNIEDGQITEAVEMCLEEGEIIDKSFILNEAAKAEFDTTEEVMNDINRNINAEISIKEEIVAEYFNDNQTVNIEEGQITEAVEMCLEEEIIDESFIEKHSYNNEEHTIDEHEETDGIKEEIVAESFPVDQIVDQEVKINENITVKISVNERKDDEVVGECNIMENIVTEIDIKEEIFEKSINENRETNSEDNENDIAISLADSNDADQSIEQSHQIDDMAQDLTNHQEVIIDCDVMEDSSLTDTNASDVTAINQLNQASPQHRDTDDIDTTSDISRTSDYRHDSSLDSLLGGGSLMEYIEDCLSSKKSDASSGSGGSCDNSGVGGVGGKLENWPNDEDCLNSIKRDFYDVSSSTNICSPHPSSESDHAHCVNNLTERVAILSAESILDSSHGGQPTNSTDSERTPTLSSPSFDDYNPELYVEKITLGDKEMDVVYFEESLLQEGGVQADVNIVRTIPVGLGGRIIGKKGKTKNELMKKFGAQLLIYNHPEEIGKQVLQITCNPSVRDQMERWVNKTLEQITKNTIQTTVSHPEWLKPMIPLGRLVAAHVVDMSTIQHVKLRIFDADIIKRYSAMQRAMNADYGSGDNTSLLPRPVAIGCVCVAMIRPDYFLRAQIVEIYDDVARVYLFDIGKVCQTYLFYLFKIREKYMRVPFQVIPARLPHALIKNKSISPALIHKRFLCDQQTNRPKLVRVFFPRMNTCCEPCVNIYVPMSGLTEPTSAVNSTPPADEFVDLLELLVSMEVCSMVRETINSDIQVKINSSHFKAFLGDKERKQVANVTVPLYFQPCNNKFYEDYVEFKQDTETTETGGTTETAVALCVQ